jgi:plasmid maintenance system antidote protein VapI
MAKTTKQPQATISETLRRAILDCGISPYELAKRTGVDQGVLSRFINSERDLRLQTADRLAPELGLELVARRKKP